MTEKPLEAEKLEKYLREDDASILLVYIAFAVYGGVLGFLVGLCF